MSIGFQPPEPRPGLFNSWFQPLGMSREGPENSVPNNCKAIARPLVPGVKSIIACVIGADLRGQEAVPSQLTKDLCAGLEVKPKGDGSWDYLANSARKGSTSV